VATFFTKRNGLWLTEVLVPAERSIFQCEQLAIVAWKEGWIVIFMLRRFLPSTEFHSACQVDRTADRKTSQILLGCSILNGANMSSNSAKQYWEGVS